MTIEMRGRSPHLKKTMQLKVLPVLKYVTHCNTISGLVEHYCRGHSILL